MANARSIGSRKYFVGSFPGASIATRASSCLNRSSPTPVRALTETIGAPSRNEPRKNSSTSSRTSSITSASTKSDLVKATTPRRIWSSRQISKCSRVCGLMDSSAAMTRRTRSMPPTPASMFRTKRSCPGTSTRPRRTSPRSRNANPRSIVIPRRFSSSSRSGFVPVSASTSADFPWSMCPAVPTMTFFIGRVRTGNGSLTQVSRRFNSTAGRNASGESLVRQIRRRSTCAISSRMAAVAARGSGAEVIGRPTTI